MPPSAVKKTSTIKPTEPKEKSTQEDPALTIAALKNENAQLRVIAEKALNENQVLRNTIKTISSLL